MPTATQPKKKAFLTPPSKSRLHRTGTPAAKIVKIRTPKQVDRHVQEVLATKELALVESFADAPTIKTLSGLLEASNEIVERYIASLQLNPKNNFDVIAYQAIVTRSCQAIADGKAL